MGANSIRCLASFLMISKFIMDRRESKKIEINKNDGTRQFVKVDEKPSV